MSHSFVACLAFGFGAMLALQGCGGGGGDSGSTTPKPSAGTTTPTTTVTVTSLTDANWKLPYCENINTYYRITYSDASVESAMGQCLPSVTPGAYYTSPGEKDGENDRGWSCWNAQMDKSLWTNEAAKTHDPPYSGACIFEDYNSKTKPADIEDCSNHLSHHPAVCSPGPSTFWGACWSSKSENWKCIPKDDATIPGLAKGDCKSQVLQDESGKPTKHFYDGVCTFPEEPLKVYKCDTVSTYSTSSSTCGGSDADKACFSLKQGVVWQCHDKDSPVDTPCEWALTPEETKEFYSGYCVFNGNDAYQHALDARNLTKAEKNHLIV